MTCRFQLIAAVLPLSIALITGCTNSRPDSAQSDSPATAQPESPAGARPESPANAQPGAADDVVWRAEVLLDTGSKLSGAVLADLDPTSPGLEAATAGYDGTMRVFTLANDTWHETIAARDTDRFHHLTSGELPGWDGIALIGVNYSGKITVVGKAR